MFYICSMSDLQVIWLQRDLRLHDHPALAAASAGSGPVLPLYIFEPNIWSPQETSARQFDFLLESLADLDSALRKRGSSLCLRTGPAAEVFSQLHRDHGIAAIHAHAVTGREAELARDRQVQAWALKAGIPLRIQTPPGMPASATRKDNWQALWEASMQNKRVAAPETLSAHGVKSEDWPDAEDFGLAADACPDRSAGGRMQAVLKLRRFLSGGGRDYGKPNLSASQRMFSDPDLSAHLAFGTLSAREIWQGIAKSRHALLEDGDTVFAMSLSAYADTLQQRSLDVQAALERTSVSGQRHFLPVDTHDRQKTGAGNAHLETVLHARTGFPLLDASMRCLRETGRLEPSLMGLLLSFNSAHLWLHPEEPARQLARLCVDFDPASFYAQARKLPGIAPDKGAYVPNPVRQSLTLDPEGIFIRRWLPELAALSDRHIHAPWDAPKSELAEAGIVLGQTYPMRMVDHMAAAREARSRFSPKAARVKSANPILKAEPPGRSFRPPPSPRPSSRLHRPPPKSAPLQMSLDL
ncbi:hypothetical protein HY29_06885 [Hyphomonas beringensis]|uniref:Photolyase/cryptochrome alpha/beta domain-containing protein n=2 Tax=Hyphomonas beringensis TaxID=1280946 RepID=A0A062TRL6_9PROT|nr:hypothetical protein HY29_06885 [Hyphomonas beringensis]